MVHVPTASVEAPHRRPPHVAPGAQQSIAAPDRLHNVCPSPVFFAHLRAETDCNKFHVQEEEALLQGTQNGRENDQTHLGVYFQSDRQIVIALQTPHGHRGMTHKVYRQITSPNSTKAAMKRRRHQQTCAMPCSNDLPPLPLTPLPYTKYITAKKDHTKRQKLMTPRAVTQISFAHMRRIALKSDKITIKPHNTPPPPTTTTTRTRKQLTVHTVRRYNVVSIMVQICKGVSGNIRFWYTRCTVQLY